MRRLPPEASRRLTLKDIRTYPECFTNEDWEYISGPERSGQSLNSSQKEKTDQTALRINSLRRRRLWNRIPRTALTCPLSKGNVLPHSHRTRVSMKRGLLFVASSGLRLCKKLPAKGSLCATSNRFSRPSSPSNAFKKRASGRMIHSPGTRVSFLDSTKGKEV